MVLGIMNMSSRDAASCSAPSLASLHVRDMNISWTMGQWDKVIIRDTTFFLDLNTLGLVIWNLESTKEGKVCAKFGEVQGVPYHWAHFVFVIFSGSRAHTEELFIAIGQPTKF